MSSVADILANQQQLASAIETVYTNFKKDGASRKTADYVKRRLDILESYWFEYEASFTRLSAKELDVHTRDVITKDRERVYERYGIIKSHIQSCEVAAGERPQSPLVKPPTFVTKPHDPNQGLTQGNPQPSGSKADQQSPNADTKTVDMLRKQHSNFKAFHRTVEGMTLDLISERWELQDLLRTVQSRWDTIDSLHWELDSELDGTNEEYERAFSAYECKYQAVKKAINKKMWSVAHMEKSTPQLEIPTFSGHYNNWVSFKDLFSETIHNNNAMSHAQKMQYLKSKVRGEAERLIQHLNVSSDNYNVCWDILNQRYNNKRLIFQSHMNTLMNLPVMQQQTVALIKRMHDTAQECLNAIKNLGVDISSWDPIIVYLLTQKLDTASYTDYMESVKNPRELPCLKEFLKYLEAKFTSLESSHRKQDTGSQKTHISNKNQYLSAHPNKPSYHKKSLTSSKIISPVLNNKNNLISKFRCPLCSNNDHGIYYCQQFLEMPPSNRLKTITKLNLCTSCLSNHQGKQCKSIKACCECNKAHNRLLHEAFAQSQYTRPSTEVGHGGEGTSARGGNHAHANENATAAKQVQRSSHVSMQEDPYEVLLPTAMIKVQNLDGSFSILRALLDQGSQTSIITEHAAQALKIPRQKCKGVISGVGDKETNSKGIVKLKCSSIVSDFSFETDALIMKQLIKNLPSYTFTKPDWSYLDHIKLADPEFYKSRPVDILLGADIYSIVIMDGICRVNSTLPTAQQTQLGWILSGNTKTFQCNVTLHNIEEIQNFWEIEDISEQSDLSLEDKQCIEFYQSTTIRREDGRYEVRLPLKPDYKEKLGSSKSKAIAQFYNLERKLALNKSIKNDYVQFIEEYLSLGHMTPAAVDRNAFLKCYLPHHCVTRNDSTTTKLRVVFNASSKTSSGSSLNDVMFRGPNLQQDLQSLILKWRQYKYAFTADIEKMFRQIWIHSEDLNLQMILWRDNPNKTLIEYHLATISYGTKAAPFLAMMTLKRLAHDERQNFQNSSAPSVLEESFYMDDLIHGAHSLQAAKQLQTDMINLLKAGGFHLRKWKSNSSELLEHVNVPIQEQDPFDFKQVESTKALGLGWVPQNDHFIFESKLLTSSKVTKRSLLSEISKIFDPLGWLSPLTTKLKILFQDVWRANLGWDELVPQLISEEWYKIRQDIHIISQFQVPRWLQTQDDDIVELHGFCDSSTKAFSCVVYCKIKRYDSSSVVLVAGKTKLVPVSKKISLPRLELCGAVLLSRLMAKIKKCLVYRMITVYGWVDSMVVLGWLNGQADRWKPFVANRVKQVTESMPADCWRYVASKENPADCASRGLMASQLREHTLWWRGPTWLPTYVPAKEDKQVYSTNQDMKSNKQVNVVLSGSEIIKQVIEKQSSLTKAVRILAWILRFTIKTKKHGYLSIQELNKAKNLIIKNCQLESFSQEIHRLKLGKGVSRESKLFSFNPILDENDILRVGGRLRHANIDPEMKHPAIISGDTRLAELIIDQAHELTYHGGARLTTAFIRRKYWIIGGNNATKKRLRLCVKCRRQNPDLQQQLMGDLPSARTNPSRPFYHCGIDYTGNVNVKSSKGRGIKTTKGYIAVFVCMATKAVHLELVSDLSTSAFLAALRRMIARRGTPGHIYSDQGKNFIGANNVLRRQLTEMQENQEFKTEIVDMGIEWHHNCPSWPSAGGLWESAVKSLKHHLKRVVGEQNLTFEELTTLLSQLEGCLNSRPLCPLTEDPDDLNFLTPSHFLSSGPVLTLYDTETDLRTRWHLTQKIFNDIWNRWRDEYLTLLTARSKWREPKSNIKLDDIVIIKDDNLPPGRWALGRVVELHPGSDGYVRVVTLKTKSGFMKRPVVKLCRLPVNEHQTQKTNDVVIKKQNLIEPPRKNKTLSFSSVAISLLLFFISIPVGHCYHNITQFPGNNSLYFDRIKDVQIIRDDWRLVVYYDTRPYLEGNKAIGKYMNYLDNICNKIQSRSHCDGVLLQLRHEVSELQYYNSLLMTHNVNNNMRHKRGLVNGVGYIANSLFGVLDDRFAQKYERDIDLIRKNQNHLAALWKNQTSVVEAEFNLLKRTEEVIDENHKLIHRKLNAIEGAINQVKTEIQNVSLVNDFLTTAMIANNLVFSLKNVQQTLLDAVTNIYSGKFNFHLLTPDQLRYELGVISDQLPKDLSLPIKTSDTLSEIYKLLQVRTRVTSRFIIFEIMIPLIDDNVYEILKIIPIPHRKDTSNEVVVVPVADYVAVNLKHDSFIPLVELDLRSCLERNTRLSLCHLRKSVQIIKDDHSFCETMPKERKCKTIITTCKNRWMELNSFNKYFFFCCEPFLIKIVCNDRVIPLQLTNSGFFSIDEGCTIKSSDFFAYSHRQKDNVLNVSSTIPWPEMSQINNIINITLPSVSVNFTSDFTRNHTAQLEDIQRNIEVMKNTEPLAEMSNHDIHHYAAIYILFVLVGLGGAVWLCRSFRCTSRRGNGASAPTPAPEREPVTTQAIPANPAHKSSVQVQCSEVKEVCDKSAYVLVKEAPKFNVPDGYLNTSTV